jgi:hypothetical protein
MTVTLLAGVEDSTQNTTNNVRDMDAPVHDLEPNAAPLTVLLEKMGSQPAINPKIEWNENESMPRITTLSASAASNATAFGPAADIFRVGDVVRATTGGFAILVSATAAGAITGAKVGSTAQVSVQSGLELYIVANANAEGALLREIKHPQLVNASNYCEIVRTPFGVTGTEEATRHYNAAGYAGGGSERARLQKYFGIMHARSQEDIYFFGARDISSTTRMCGGLKEFLSTNVTNDSGGTTEAEWQTFLKPAFRFGSRRKVAFCSPSGIQCLEGFARSNIQVVNDRGDTYGINMSTYVSGQGTVDLVSHVDWQDSTIYGGYIFLVDMDAIKKRPLRDTKLREGVQAPDYDGYKDEYLGEYSLQVTHERRHSLLTGMTGA